MARITCNISAVTPLEDVMNCKEGDLAIVVGGLLPNSPNRGKIVRCVRFVPKMSMALGKVRNQSDGWETDIPLIHAIVGSCEANGAHKFAADAYLRPIRSEPGEDETLTWAGKPNAKHKKTSCK